MADQPMVAWLEAKLDRAEMVARSVPRGPWMWMNRDVPAGRWSSLEGPGEEPVLRTRSDHSSRLERHPAFDEFLPEPEAMLRRVAADRKILAEHAPGDLIGIYGETECRTCSGPQPGFSGAWPMEWPCRTVRLLAEAYGWTEDGS